MKVAKLQTVEQSKRRTLKNNFLLLNNEKAQINIEIEVIEPNQPALDSVKNKAGMKITKE